MPWRSERSDPGPDRRQRTDTLPSWVGGKAGILTTEEADQLREGLDRVAVSPRTLLLCCCRDVNDHC